MSADGPGITVCPMPGSCLSEGSQEPHMTIHQPRDIRQVTQPLWASGFINSTPYGVSAVSEFILFKHLA